MSVEIEQHCDYEATVRLRRGDGWAVRPEAEALDGRRGRFRAYWPFEPGERAQHEGEWAMRVPREWGPVPAWIASGDLVDIVEAG